MKRKEYNINNKINISQAQRPTTIRLSSSDRERITKAIGSAMSKTGEHVSFSEYVKMAINNQLKKDGV